MPSFASSEPAVLAAQRPLDLHEELSDDGGLDRQQTRCNRWPRNAWLVSDRDVMVQGRCKATNLCDYCGRLAAVENTEMLALDALEGEAPELWTVLSTRTSTVDMSRFYGALQLVVRHLRARWPGLEYASLLEYTTGYGPRSGGRRRPHWNLLWKGVPAGDRAELHAIASRIWCEHVDAGPRGQKTTVVRDVGLMRYLALHFQKESQRPPAGFRGQRFNCSRGYFRERTRREMRLVARRSLREKRAIRMALKLGYVGQEAEDLAAEDLWEQDDTVWAIYVEEQCETDPSSPTTGHSSTGTEPPTPSGTTPAIEPSALFDGSTPTTTRLTGGDSVSVGLTVTAGGGLSVDGSVSWSASSTSELCARDVYDLLAMGASWQEISELQAGIAPRPATWVAEGT